jgi:hypothetical protein
MPRWGATAAKLNSERPHQLFEETTMTVYAMYPGNLDGALGVIQNKLYKTYPAAGYDGFYACLDIVDGDNGVRQYCLWTMGCAFLNAVDTLMPDRKNWIRIDIPEWGVDT